MLLRKNVSLAFLNSFKIGGRAEYFFRAKNPEELIEVFEWAKSKKIPCKVFAGGSNAVFNDGKIKNLFVQISGGDLKIKDRKIFADAGVSLKTVVQKSVKSGLAGAESLSGIPGTLGGAIIGNAGAYGQSISKTVEKVEIWDSLGAQRKGKRRWLKNKECNFSYRESIFKEEPYILLRAVLKFRNGDKIKLLKTSKEIIKIRNKKYNPKINCPGSFFKNVQVKNVPKKSLKLIDAKKIRDGKIPAGYLLEKAGACGMRIGKIKVADFHGNLLMNLGGGRARDVKKMAAVLKARVRKKFGIELEEEVVYF